MKRILALLAATLLTACGGGGGAPEPAPQPLPQQPSALRVFIFAGQSSMNGADAVIAPSLTLDLVETSQQTDADRSGLFTMASPSISHPWGDIRGHAGTWNGEPVIDGRTVKVHGPEVGFNRAMGGGVAIIKHANNYQALEAGRSAWVRPGSRWQLWQTYVDAQLAALNRPYVVAGVIWFQGIDDAVLSRGKAEYQADLVQIAADVRAKFGNIPFIIGRSVNSSIVGASAMVPIRQAQTEVGGLPGNGLVSVDDLGPYPGHHHLSAAAHLVAGQRFASEYLRLR